MSSLLTAKKFLSDVIGTAEAELKRLGFRKSGGVYTYKIDDIVLGWVGLNTIAKRSDGRVGVNPMVGVVCIPIEALLQELTASRDSRLNPTLSTSLGYVATEARFQEWPFEPEPFDYRTEAIRMVEAIHRYGRPFMESKATLNEVTLDLEQVRSTSKESVVYRLPVAYALTERVDVAVAQIQAHLCALANRTDMDAHRFKTFATAFLGKFTQ